MLLHACLNALLVRARALHVRTLMPCLRKTPSGGRMMARMIRTTVTALSAIVVAAAEAAAEGIAHRPARRGRPRPSAWARARACGRSHGAGRGGANRVWGQNKTVVVVVAAALVLDRGLRRPGIYDHSSRYRLPTPMMLTPLPHRCSGASKSRRGRLPSTYAPSLATSACQLHVAGPPVSTPIS
jgi:hypothetical protein